LRPPVREIEDSTQALASHIMSGVPPSYPGHAAAPAQAPFDMDKTVELSGGFKPVPGEAAVPEEQMGELFPPLEPLIPASPGPAATPARDPMAKTIPPGAFKPAPGAPRQAVPAQAPHKPAQAPVFKPTPSGGGAGPGGSAGKPGVKELQPEDFDKTVILTGGFEAQPPEEDTPSFDDLFPPIKF
jgi:hypothetical protein